jgi:CO/xanthine dehydrogenase Mo-binding subunit
VSHAPAPGGGWVGQPVPLKEDARLVAGRGRFVDDLGRPRMLHAAMLRSPHAHARIVAIDTREAEALPGVLAVLTGAEAAARSGPIRPLIPTTAAVPDHCLAVDRARYVGEPVAAVAAVDRATAEDARERIPVE